MNEAQGKHMSSLIEALRDKISVLEDEREELEDALGRVTSRISTLEELLKEEEEQLGEDFETEEPAPEPKKKRGRPRKNPAKKVTKKKTARKKKVSRKESTTDADYQEAVRTLPGGKGTTKEEAAAAAARYNPTPRPPIDRKGVKVYSKKGKPPVESSDDVHISVEDE
jgi:ABC-type transporter Mla subunit MlaD